MPRRSSARRSDDQQCPRPIGHSRDGRAETVALAFPGDLQQQLSIAPRINVRCAATFVISRSADDYIGYSILIHIPSRRNMTAELIVAILGRHRDEYVPVFS